MSEETVVPIAAASNGLSLSQKYARTALLLGIALLIAVRIPSIWTQGRFWAEEGSIFFVNAWHVPWYKVLLFTYGGYLNFAANLAAVLANHLVSLEWAPYVSIIFAFLIQIFPAALLCLSKQKWLQDIKMLLAALLIVITLPFSHEVWLTSISTQCHLNLCAGLILALEPGVGSIALFQYILLFFAPLSGPGASFLVPLFIARAVIDRSKSRAIQAAILGLAAALQLLFFYHPADRQLGISPPLLLNVFFVKHLLEPFLGQQSESLVDPLRDSFVAGHASIVAMLVALIVFGIFAVAIWRTGKAEPIWFFLSGMLMAILSYCGALGNRVDLLFAYAANRYVFAPQILLELSLLSLSCVSRGRIRLISTALIIWLVVIGLREYFYTPGMFSVGPSWRSEVRQWRKNPEYKLEIWPKGWYVTLQSEYKIVPFNSLDDQHHSRGE